MLNSATGVGAAPWAAAFTTTLAHAPWWAALSSVSLAVAASTFRLAWNRWLLNKERMAAIKTGSDAAAMLNAITDSRRS
jgi:hypothetical protein